jgi:hypothetical protein
MDTWVDKSTNKNPLLDGLGRLMWYLAMHIMSLGLLVCITRHLDGSLAYPVGVYGVPFLFASSVDYYCILDLETLRCALRV